MAETVRLVDYYYATIPDKPGEVAKILSPLREAGVNLLAVHAFPTRGRTQVDIVPEDAAAFLKAARKAKLKLSAKKRAFLVTGEDRVGALAGIVDKIAEAKINITAVTAVSAGEGRFGTILWVKAHDVGKVSKAFGI